MIELQLHYGPYEVGGIIKHRSERLIGLRDLLQECGFSVKLVKWKLYDRLAITMNRHQLFTCRVTYLQYPYFDDPVRDLAVQTVINAMKGYIDSSINPETFEGETSISLGSSLNSTNLYL